MVARPEWVRGSDDGRSIERFAVRPQSLLGPFAAKTEWARESVIRTLRHAEALGLTGRLGVADRSDVAR